MEPESAATAVGEFGLQIAVLGPLRCFRGDEEIPLPTPKERLILSMLAVQAPNTVPFAALADAVWPEGTNANWRKGLQLHVFRLRKRLTDDEVDEGREVIVTVGDGYALGIAPEAIDLHRFAMLVAAGQRRMAEDQPADAERALREALDLWRADPLVELAGTPLGEAHAARLGELHLAAMEELHDAELALGRHSSIVPRIEACLVEHPLRERLWRQLMVALYRSGRQADALRAYQRARQRLVDELGLEPGRDLRRVEAAIVAQDPDLDWVAPMVAATPERGGVELDDARIRWTSRVRTSPLRGRIHERQVLRGAWRRLESDSMQIVTLAGPEGIGKTRLLAELAVECAEQGVEVHACWCTRGDDVAYAPLRELMGHGPGNEGAPQSTADVVGWVQERLASGPVALLVDDVGWADAATIASLRALARSCADQALLLVLAQQESVVVPPHVQDFLVDLARHPGHRRMELGGLGLDEGVAVLAFELGRSDDGAPLDLATLFYEAGGNPLFLIELARHAVDQASVDADGQIRVDSVMADLGLPASLRAVVHRRCAALDPADRLVLGAGAVLGSTFDFRLVSQLAGVSEMDAVAVLERSTALGLVGDAAESGEVAFSSTVVRAAIYADLTSARRALLHQRAGELLGTVGLEPVAARVPAMVDHFARARAPEAGLRGSGRADDRYVAERLRPAYEEAIGRFEASLVESTEPEADQWCGLLLGLATGRWKSGDLGAAQELFTKASDEARRLERPDLFASAVSGLAQVVLEVGVTHPPVISLLDEARALLPEDHPLQQQVRASIVPELVWAGRWKEAVQIARA